MSIKKMDKVNKKSTKKSMTHKSSPKMKDKLIEALYRHDNHISKSCDDCALTRKTFYEWRKKDTEFDRRCQDVEESLLDMTENALIKKIKQGDTTSIIFRLKTKGKSRGYIERQEIQANVHTSALDEKDQQILKSFNDLDQ